jgi:diguanylate cyclase (GGDEF)-like protein
MTIGLGMTVLSSEHRLRSTVAWRAWPLFQVSRLARYYVVAVSMASAVAIGYTAAHTTFVSHQIVSFAILLCCGLASVEATRRIDYTQGVLVRDLLTVWCLPVAILLPPFYALVVPGPLLALTQLRVHRGLIYRRVFSAAAISLAYGSASWMFRALPASFAGPAPHWGRHTVTWGLAVAACDVLAWLVNNWLIVVAIKSTDRTARLRDLIFNTEALFADFVQWNLAVVITLVAGDSPVLLVFAAPAVLMQRRFMMHAQLLSSSRIDSKTGLLNAAAWEREASAQITRATRAHAPVTVALIDIDRFKTVNDTYGHLAGDEVLKAVSRMFTETLRAYDVVGRFGGEEFVVLLPRTNSEDALRIAERLRHHVAESPISISPGDGSLRVAITVSIGIASLAGAHRQLTDLLAAADTALYIAKDGGRNQTRVMTDDSYFQPAPEPAN